jgi:glycosyltransferase involved in cell wall biosynthesis
MNNINAHSPTFSLITVCRNSATTIAKTIESVLAQKDSGVEYIIIDGASVDGTQDIVRSYQMIDFFISEPDQGIADAFNKGIQMANGDIVGLINSDDHLCPSALISVRRYFSEHPEVDVIHGDVILLEDDMVIKRIKPAGRWWYPWRLVLFNHPATFVRREVYGEYGFFDVSYRIAMDVEIFFRWMSSGVKINYLPEVLVKMQAGGASGQHALKGYREVRRAALQHKFNPFLVYVQFAGKLMVWWMLETVALIRHKRVQIKVSR